MSKYYFAGASRIAVRKYVVPQTTTLNYLAGDHLGSTSLVTNASGALVAETRYKPWGEVRYTTSNQTLPTRYTFTGQYSYVNDDATDLGAAGFGLMFYNARWYDPALGRMAQADTVVPGGVQGLDRYAYGLNNPSRYTDPSGHRNEDWQKSPSSGYQGCNWMNNYTCPTPGTSTPNTAAPWQGFSGPPPSYWSPEAKNSWFNMQSLGILGNSQTAMEYVTGSECTPYTCTTPQLPAAMMHRYNEFCSGGTWTEECVQSFWGYMQGIRNADTTKLGSGTDYTRNLAAAILGNPQNPNAVTYTNDGQGCGNNNLCSWGNLTTDQAKLFRDEFLSTLPNCRAGDDGSHCYLHGPDSPSVWLHYQGEGGVYQYFIVMDIDTDSKYCSPPYNWCAH